MAAKKATFRKLNKPQRQALLKRYKMRAEHAARQRDKEGLEQLWKRLVDLYRGRHFNPAMLEDEDRIAVNIVFATINVIAPAVSVNYPKLCVYAQRPEDDAKSAILETVLNYWWRHFSIQHEVVLAVRDWLIIGHGWLKVGWRYVEEQTTIQDEVLNGVADDDSGDGPLTPNDPTEATSNDPDDEETDDLPYEVTEDRPFVERVSPHDIFVDPEAKTLRAAKWIAQKIVKPLEEVRQDERYSIKGRKCLEPDAQLNPDWLEEGAEPNDDIKRVTIYEFYDLQLGTMCVFPHKGDDFLLEPIPQPYVFGHPFVMLRNYEVPDEFYPMGDVEALEPLQLELDKTRTQMMNHRKRFNRKYLYNPESFDAGGRAQLQSDQDNVMVPVIPGSVNALSEAVIPIAQVTIEPQLYQYSQDVEANMDRVSGLTDYQQGAVPEVRRTATEASMIQDAANARSADKIAQVELMIAEIGAKVIQLAQQYLTEDQVARLIGKNGHPIWIPYGREDIQGEFDFEVEAGSTQPHNESFRKNQALQLLQAMTPWAQAGLVNAQELLRFALQYGFQIKNVDDFMAAPQPQQEGQQKSPHQSMIESINYKDAPPDIQRQMEQMAGFQPSQTGGSSPAEQLIAQQMQAQGQQGVQQQMGQNQLQAQLAQQQTQAQQAHHERAHQAAMEHMKQQHEGQMAQVEAARQAQLAQQQHEQATEQADQAAGHGLVQQMMAAEQQPQQPTKGK